MALDCMPLAITQTAAYIRERRPRCSVWQYREEMEQSRASRTSLLRRDVPLPSRDAEASNSGPEGPDGARAFEDYIVALRSFSFDATLLWLEEYGRLDEVQERFVHGLCTTFPTGHFENWPTCRALFPHAKGAAEQKPTSRSALLEWATVMYRSVWYALEQGELIDALAMATSSMTARLEELGEEDKETSWSSAIVANAYLSQGRLKEAEELQVKVMEASSRVLGEKHPTR
ncbi:hypothetical protein B0A55_07960 [Friedmanniomyces simplex]|uniref:MalT-like TPR region domain-containing protein n=1 Tax=Friedmanniomyces simplex TaxID=329884 RepID=A0A4U0XGP3_9PEZI|nr:hypothetical protein B0A55_07960 [Friedmanniomyces simplex]